MRLYDWEIRIKENQGTAQVNVKFGVEIKSKDYMKFQDGLTQLADKYHVGKPMTQKAGKGK